MIRHLNSLLELSPEDVQWIFDRTRRLKQAHQAGQRPALLAGRVLTQIFEKPSLRTRLSFDAAMMQLGGQSIFLTARDAGLNGREAVADVARVIGSYCDVIAMRTFSQQLIDDFIRYAGVPVINGLSDQRHPCQALTDVFTLQEIFGELAGRRLVFVGDGNNVASSLAAACALSGVLFRLCCPPGYEIPAEVRQELQRRFPQASVEVTHDLAEAVKDADVIYTDVWTSMGQETEEATRRRVFQPYQIHAHVMARAPATARFMHCLPARRGQEVTDEILDGPQSVVFQQAENRMHVAKGILCWVLHVEP
ncbi:MAG: ornithine carbamoyltransferase [Planctomycetaceae bacterium]|nr:MAG: ornithine carbamoyltransferase [Planctomycetaceae bacterium]